MTGRTALLSIDLQADFLDRPGLVPDKAALVAGCAALLGHARGQGWLVVHVRTLAEGGEAMPHRREAPEVVAGSPGAEPPPALAALPAEPVILKRFFDPFDSPELDALLRAEGVGRLVLMGVQAHACVRETATSAYARGYSVEIAEEAVGSDSPAHGALALDWLDRRMMKRRPIAELGASPTAPRPWRHQDPTDTRQTLFELGLDCPANVAATAEALAAAQRDLDALGVERRRDLLLGWHGVLAEARLDWVEALVADVAKPRRDAEGEVDYGLALLAAAAAALDDGGDGRVRFRPHGLVGLITPWNNPFAIPLGKLAPALGFGNAALWKPALPGGRIAEMIKRSLDRAGLGRWVGLVQGDSAVGRAIVADPHVAALSFTGSVAVGRSIIAAAAGRAIPVQAELGGNNAAIVDENCDLGQAAADLAPAIFSFSGQRCTAIRRLVVLDPAYDAFAERLAAEVATLRVGLPADPATAIGPLIGKAQQQKLLGRIDQSRKLGARLVAGGTIPAESDPAGCWLAPTLLDSLGADDPLLGEEQFGPICTLHRAADFDQAVAIHNRGDHGLLGALFSADEARQALFLDRAEAGILSIGQARPAFAPDGPFIGWKASGFGPPEHGRWNRDVYAKPQAVYRR